jgi:hypothetical protein
MSKFVTLGKRAAAPNTVRTVHANAVAASEHAARMKKRNSTRRF